MNIRFMYWVTMKLNSKTLDYLKDANDTTFVSALFMHSIVIQMMNDEISPRINGSCVYSLCWVCPGVRGEVRDYWLLSLCWVWSVWKHVYRLLVSIWQSRRGSIQWCYLCSLIEQAKTTGLTQTVVKSSHFIPKDQKGWRNHVRPSSYLTAVLFLVHMHDHSNRFQNSIWKSTDQLNYKNRTAWCQIISDHSCCGFQIVFFFWGKSTSDIPVHVWTLRCVSIGEGVTLPSPQ